MAYSEHEIREIVRRVLLRTLGVQGERQQSQAAQATVTEAEVLSVPYGGQLSVPPGARVTPLARDAALERNVSLVSRPGEMPAPQSRSAARGKRTVALGADHGGYSLKEDLKGYVAELGYDVVDCGTKSTESVDYPDFAYAVAQLVSDGRAWRGIIVDGAGIGSCMAANKVPGVRAAMCYDHATAVNSREHNDANVLSLGGMLLGQSLARQIVKAWLETEFGGGRHARRVDKIMGIERRFLRK
jgi:ribose 5-phosphate isomerase B